MGGGGGRKTLKEKKGEEQIILGISRRQCNFRQREWEVDLRENHIKRGTELFSNPFGVKGGKKE